MPLERAPRDLKDLRCTRHIEAHLFRRGWQLVAGCDEVGRGALIGPVFAAAVILDRAKRIRGLNDSKQLTHEVRVELEAEIRSKAICYKVVDIPAARVDEINIYHASRQAMIEAVAALLPLPDFVLTDAMRLSGWGDAIEFAIPHRSLIHGDARSASIAAASILAKVARDALMVEMDRTYPHYQLAKNKGYGTPEHKAALDQFGPCPEHRRSFAPVRQRSLPFLDQMQPSGLV
jgi:ribonuclease HII